MDRGLGGAPFRTHASESMTADARLMVATEVVADAELVRKLLEDEFDNVTLSIDPERAVKDFDKQRPEVLVLAFNTLEKAERYYLGLYRLSAMVHALPHRTVILCNKDDLRRVYELCKKEYFDDYVLFWPVSQDVFRLSMTIHLALRQMAGNNAGEPSMGEIAAQARRVAELETQLEEYAARGGQHVDVASRSLRQAEHDVSAALDGFSRKLSEGGLGDMVHVHDRVGLQREIDRLKADEIETRFQSVAAAVQPVRQWAGAFRENLAPQLESVRSLKRMADRVRPVVLVVDDDEFQHKLLRNILGHSNLDTIFAATGTEALAVLRKHRPDLILMDFDLPDIDGVEVTRRLKSAEQHASIPVVMITGHSDKQIVMKSLQAGAVDFIVKPFDKETLLAKVRGYLSGSHPV